MLLEVGELGELPLTDLTPVGLDTQVDAGVLGEVGAVGECLAAGGALVGFGFSHMDLSVELQVSFTGKYLGGNVRGWSHLGPGAHLRAHLALVLSDGGSTSTVLGVRGLEGVAQVGLGEHLGSVDRLRDEDRVGGWGRGGGG